MLVTSTQVIYLGLSVIMTVLVARSLKNNGRVFLLKSFKGDDLITDSINSLLVVGFYLINIGWILLWTNFGDKPDGIEVAFEFITTKVGVVLLILGCLHFINMRIFWNMQKNT